MPSSRWTLVAVALSLALALLCLGPVWADPARLAVGEKSWGIVNIALSVMERPLAEWGRPHLHLYNHPDGIRPILVGLPQLLLARGLAAVVAPPVAVQLSLLLHAASAGVAGYLLSTRVVGGASPWPHLLAGLAWQASPQVLAGLANGQLENVGQGYLALAALGGWTLVARARPSGLLLLVLGLALAFLSTPYLVMAGLLGAAPALALALRRRPRATALLALAILAVVGAGYRHFAPTAADGEVQDLCPAQVSRDIDPGRALPLDGDAPRRALHLPAVGPTEHVVDAAWVLRPGQRDPASERYEGGYLGWAALLLGLLGARRDRTARWLLACVPLPLVLGMGPYLVVNGWVPTVAGSPLSMPLHWLQSLPLLGGAFAKAQVPVRLVSGAELPLALAAAVGLRGLAPALRPALLALPVAEQLLLGPVRLPWPVQDLGPRPAWTALAALPDRRAVLATPPAGFPREGTADGRPFPFAAMREEAHGTSLHGHPVPYGRCGEVHPFHPSAYDSAFNRVVAEVREGRDPPGALRAAARELAAQGYGYWLLALGSGVLTPEEEARLLAAGQRELRVVHRGADGWVFGVE